MYHATALDETIAIIISPSSPVSAATSELGGRVTFTFVRVPAASGTAVDSA
jgi:hypothetical protein